MFKKFLSLLVCILPFAMCCACSGNTKSGNGSTISDASSVTNGEPISTEPVITINVKKNDITKFKSDRPYDENKEDISIILVVGQSNFTTGVGYLSHNYHYANGKTDIVPEKPIQPAELSCYSGTYKGAITALTSDRDLYNLCNPNTGISLGGVTPSFGAKWSALTGTKTVFLQMAHGATGMHEWTPHPADYSCTCTNNGEGTLYSNAVEQYKKTYEALSKDYNIVYTGYIWNQGEHEEYFGKQKDVTINSAQAYYDAYKLMHDGFMNELKLDFGGISVVRSHFIGKTSKDSSSYTIARAAQYKLCYDISNLYMLSTISETCSVDMMDPAGPIHYSQSVFNIMGDEMADNLYSVLGLGESPVEYSGITITSGDGVVISEFDATGKLTNGSDKIIRANTNGPLQLKLSALGRNDSYEITTENIPDGFIDKYGKLNWSGMKSEDGTPITEVTIKVNVQ